MRDARLLIAGQEGRLLDRVNRDGPGTPEIQASGGFHPWIEALLVSSGMNRDATFPTIGNHRLSS
ncbi:MAG: hypothetical protein U1E83_00910 [Methylotetracoccus sp.]